MDKNYGLVYIFHSANISLSWQKSGKGDRVVFHIMANLLKFQASTFGPFWSRALLYPALLTRHQDCLSKKPGQSCLCMYERLEFVLQDDTIPIRRVFKGLKFNKPLDTERIRGSVDLRYVQSNIPWLQDSWVIKSLYLILFLLWCVDDTESFLSNSGRQ